jgi:hypothetical protein
MMPDEAPKPEPANDPTDPSTADTQPRIMLRPRPAPLMHAERCALFGRFSFTPDPQPGNPEHVEIGAQWVLANLRTVTIPQMGNRSARVHKLIAPQFLRMWEAWQVAGVLPGILTLDGTWAPRFKRGYRFGEANLSNHAWGTAMDLNARWNPLGAVPAAAGTKGSTRELVAIANDCGFAWGGDFHSRQDGMHFEAYKVLT